MKEILLIGTVLVSIMSCNNNAGGNKPDVKPAENINDTLPDDPQFSCMVGDTNYSFAAPDIDVHYSASDSALTIDAGPQNGERLHIVIADVKHTPGSRGNAWRSNTTKLAGTDSLVYEPTVTFIRNEGGFSSWNNLNDGYHTQQPGTESSLFIYGLRQTDKRNFMIKGRINTHLLKNVYASGHKEFNKDQTVTGQFVIQFEDYWLKL
jgi:hypothetical protein